MGTGGPDMPYYERELEALAGKTSVSGHITQTTLNTAYSILRREGIGHFIIKAPNDYVGLVTYYYGRFKESLFKMGNGQYVSVPNSPSYYRSGYISTVNPISSAISLETTDKYGINRRNIITYQVMNINYSTQVKIWASTCRGTPDGIIFGSKTISKYSIPKIPNKLYIGQVTLKNPQITNTNPINMQTGVNGTATISIKFNENIKPSTYYNSITIKKLSISKTVSISKSISGTTLKIKTTSTTTNAWYQVTIPAKAVKDYAGNNLQATYSFKFKTET